MGVTTSTRWPEPEVLSLFERCSNRDRWGPDDQLGTLNYISPSVRLKALETVTQGETYSIGRDLLTSTSRQQPSSATHVMGVLDPDRSAAVDYVGVWAHGFEVTHVDAVAHNAFQGLVFNGRDAAQVVLDDGLMFGSVMAMADGILTRGVLLDVARARGVDHLSAGEGISVADLEAAEVLAGTHVEMGDAVFVRSGRDVRLSLVGEPEEPREGVLPEVIPWLHDRKVAMYSGDCIEQLPSGYEAVTMPLHQIGLVAMGLALLDNPDIERLCRLCDHHARSVFAVVVAPLRVPRGTGSAVNPIVMF